MVTKVYCELQRATERGGTVMCCRHHFFSHRQNVKLPLSGSKSIILSVTNLEVIEMPLVMNAAVFLLNSFLLITYYTYLVNN